MMGLVWLMLLLNGVTAQRFSVVIDAGSTGCRIFVYELSELKGAMEVVRGERGPKSTPGLASLSSNLARPAEERDKALAAYVRPLLRFAKEAVASSEWSRTPFELLATAGMRLLDDHVARKMYDALYDVFRSADGGMLCPFAVKRRGLRTISGDDEAYYAALTANYVLGRIDAARRPRTDKKKQLRAPGYGASYEVVGALDLGGASTQIAAPMGNSSTEANNHLLGRSDFATRSYLGFGVERIATAYRTFVDDAAESQEAGFYLDPCDARGHERLTADGRRVVRGSGEHTACIAQLALSLGLEACLRGANSSIERTFPPRERRCELTALASASEEVPKTKLTALRPVTHSKFVGLSLYYYAWRTLEVALARVAEKLDDNNTASFAQQASDELQRTWPSPSLRVVHDASVALCSTPWSTVRQVAVAPLSEWDDFMGDADHREREFPRRCLELAYIELLLGEVYRIPSDERAVMVALQVEGLDLDWTLGAVFDGYHAASSSKSKSYSSITASKALSLFGPFVLLAYLIGIALLCALQRHRNSSRYTPGLMTRQRSRESPRSSPESPLSPVQQQGLTFSYSNSDLKAKGSLSSSGSSAGSISLRQNCYYNNSNNNNV